MRVVARAMIVRARGLGLGSSDHSHCASLRFRAMNGLCSALRTFHRSSLFVQRFSFRIFPHLQQIPCTSEEICAFCPTKLSDVSCRPLRHCPQQLLQQQTSFSSALPSYWMSGVHSSSCSGTSPRH
ncbi:hypothetical protein MPTK1_1g25710 [Marchantia polymorpha subsp. ruderalis]|uniref:Uncharacterized protein n=2 Tax=Marchantia polymorpha TaxID=3197 RepID=A0AAF6AU92_MARPO|nr:hypothetical protein MARPO_1100s0001 [Marchantia polymorpha]BBN00013.1 hypothetical protein Mp_1g25710 [Marchantia polymorpha subsp. ruderalis]|eukprot:PTQ26533.1 hypothetical protein MARPO_1100s0001 [Marchantia polymorpha]